MGKSQRTKGAVFEREIAHWFGAFFGKEFKRNIGQARDGGNDIDVGPLVVEAKRRASLKVLRSWFEQAVVAADRRQQHARDTNRPGENMDHIPIVVMREDGGTMPLVLMGGDDFLALVDAAKLRGLERA